MYLYINTSSPEGIVLAVINKSGEILKFKRISVLYKHSEKLLPAIKSLVLNFKKLKGIVVVIGPGSFTSLRIGIATANAMAWSLNIPILGIGNKNNLDDKVLLDKNFKKILNKDKFKKQVLPKYGREPNITISKK